MVTTLLAGLGFGLGLIVAIGAQNAFVLRQGLRREHVGPVVAVCVISDVILIAVGAAGVGKFVSSNTTLLTVVTVLGAAVLLGYAALAIKRVVRPEALAAEVADDGNAHLAASAPQAAGLGQAANAAQHDGTTLTLTRPTQTATRPAKALGAVVLTALALTWLNPHVYLDTLVLLGSVSASYPLPWVFAAGAALASLGWFTALGFGARVLAPLFAKPRAWQIFDGAIAVVMVALAVKLLAGLGAA